MPPLDAVGAASYTVGPCSVLIPGCDGECGWTVLGVLRLTVTGNTIAGCDQASFALHTLILPATPGRSSEMIITLFNVFDITVTLPLLLVPNTTAIWLLK